MSYGTQPMKKHLRFFCTLGAAALSALLFACDSEPAQKGPVNIDRQLVEYLNEPYFPFEPELGAAIPATAKKPLVNADLPYPPFYPHDLKTIGPESWIDRQPVYDANVGGVIFNMIWSKWQPTPNLDPKTPNSFEHEGKIWLISKAREKQIRWFSKRGIKVTAVVYGTPEWARKVNTAKVGNVPLVDEGFIAPDDPSAFASFAGMLAKRYNGANGNGRIVNFVIQNEVNALDWFNPGCGAADAPCKVEDRINAYADIYNQAYDKIIAEQPEARVMYSFDHHFGLEYKNSQRFSSAQHFIEALEPMVGNRQWRIAYHSYPADLFNPVFGPYDYPKITFGNLGVLAGYLRQNYPDRPHTWEIHLTENGLNSGAPSSDALMQQQLRLATRNVIGTPGVETFFYHRLKDHSHEGNFTPGLFDANGRTKSAWDTWANNNHFDHNPPKLDDGYELLPYISLTRSARTKKAHWASTRLAPPGYTPEASFLMLREPAPNTTMLYECHVERIKGTYISRDINCSGNTNFGPVGNIYNESANNRLPLYTVNIKNGSNYLLSNQANEANGQGTLLGYVDSAPVVPRAFPTRDPSYYDTEYDGAVTGNDAQTTPATNTDAETVTVSWGDCAAGNNNKCGFIQLNHTAGQTHKLNCRTEHLTDTDITLSYGNTANATVENLAISGVSMNPTQNIYLNIPDDSTWASVTLTTASANLASCVLLSKGGLSLSSALDQNRYGLLYNGGFEASITDWEFCVEESTSAEAYEGAKAAGIENSNCVFQEVEIEPGHEYTMTCYALSSDGDTSIGLTIANSSYQTLLTNTETVDGDTYQRYSATLTAPATSSFAVVSMTTTGSALLDSCSLKHVIPE